MPATWWYLSFSEGAWLGAAIVRGEDVFAAAQEAHRRGCNPGGEVLGAPLLEEQVPAGMTNRLLSEDDVKALDAANGGTGEVQSVIHDEDGLRLGGGRD